jgi:hypothetical protein
MFREEYQRYLNRFEYRLAKGINKAGYVIYEPNQYYLRLRKWR